LAKVDNPALAIRVDLPRSTDLPHEIATGDARCPSCGRIVEKSWGYCPFCDALLDKPPRIGSATLVEKETRGDTTAIGAGLIVLSILGGLGIIVYFCGGSFQQPAPDLPYPPRNFPSEQAGTNGMIISACLFGLVIVGMVLAAKGRGQVASIGMVVLGALTIPLLLLAGVISFFVYIAAGCHPGF
jgi:hypothetical protein